MNKAICILFLHIYSQYCFAQEPAIKIGERFPDYIIRPVINAPVKQYDVARENKKYLILNFWGTWCAPCIPEMIALAKLQEENKGFITVIAISNETTDRLVNYLKKRPSNIWLASDTSSHLYNKLFAFNYVGQSAIISPDNKLIALVRIDSINQNMIDRLKKHLPVNSSAETGNKREKTVADLFNVDSSMSFQISFGAARPKESSMRKTYGGTAFEKRRISYLNVPDAYLLQEAYDIHGEQVIYLPDLKSFQGRSVVCFDILVAPSQKDSLKIIMQQALKKLLDIKARVERKIIPVYVLTRNKADTITWKQSAETETNHWFSGKGFNGTAIKIKIFADYISNELSLPVVDETGLNGKYDINTVNVLRSKEEVLKNIEKLGLKVEKTEREMDVLAISKEN